MKNKLTKVIFTTLLVASSLMAGSQSDETRSLVGVEVGYGSMDVGKDSVGSSSASKAYSMIHGGVKIGAQSNDYRLFLSVRYYNASDFDYVTTYGAELQYLIDITPAVNFYLGANAGVVNIKYSPSGETITRTASDSYMGGDAGVNVHLNEAIDLEFGARILMIDISNTIDSVTYTFDNMISGYVGVIYKFKMD